MRTEPGSVDQRFERALENAEGFFMKAGKVHHIRAAELPAELADDLNPYVRDKYLELWRAAQIQDRE